MYFIKRILAYSLDYIISWLFTVLAFYLCLQLIELGISWSDYGSAFHMTKDYYQSEPVMFSLFLLTELFISVRLLYIPMALASKWQATIGLRLLGLYATRVDGERLSFKRALFRSFMALTSYMTFFLGFLFAGGNDLRQTFHDKLSRSVVVSK